MICVSQSKINGLIFILNILIIVFILARNPRIIVPQVFPVLEL